MPKNTAPAANSAGVFKDPEIISNIYTPPEAAEGAEGAKNHGLRDFFHNFHACCAHRAHESRYFHECARHLAPVCRDRKRARVLRAPWSWGAFEKSRPNPVPPLRVSFLDQKIMKTGGMAPGNNLKCTREHFKRRPEFVFARGNVLDVVRNVS